MTEPEVRTYEYTKRYMTKDGTVKEYQQKSKRPRGTKIIRLTDAETLEYKTAIADYIRANPLDSRKKIFEALSPKLKYLKPWRLDKFMKEIKAERTVILPKPATTLGHVSSEEVVEPKKDLEVSDSVLID